MTWRNEWKPFLWIAALFLAFYSMPIGGPRFDNAVTEALSLAKWYAREHVLLCLIPAFFIAGAIAVFISKASVMKYLGARANKVLAYGVASVSGSVLAVCSCTVLPLFAGIYRMGAGIGPATAFLYSGPAINILAIVLTARILGVGLGVARAVGAVLFSVVIGLVMHAIFRKEELAKANAQAAMPEPEASRPLWKTAVYFASMAGFLVFANWGRPRETSGAWFAIYSAKWAIAFACLAALVVSIFFLLRMKRQEAGEWIESTWEFAKQIMPLLLVGVLVSGFLLGRPGNEGIIPSSWVSGAVGGNSLLANLFASVAGAFMYFATLTEVPIVQGLIGSGMGKGPALALLLAGPALSLPSMIVIRSIMGTRKAVTYILLVIVLSTITGLIYGAL
ncbi:MAG: permease [Candidatus Krumholzibacteria bacterium]|nr:permease [Candidatus Krumholzibacteria bacterium]